MRIIEVVLRGVSGGLPLDVDGNQLGDLYMPVRVSVIVPVYNPGAYIEPCIDSILGQSMPPGEYEAIFVDDGSTDDTPARLDQLAAENPNVRAFHIPNSGWPGKPRNVGIDAACGEFILFLDHDDRLGAEALQRMYDFGVANDADVIVGKMTGVGRAVPRELFRTNRPRATVNDAPLIDSLTPHKMFRGSFLHRIGLRFPEGRRRLEDHVFVTEAYLRARNVAVLSDYVCYVHVRRADTANAGLQLFDPVGYFANLREALDVVERFTAPGPLRDKLFRRWFRNEMIERMRGRRMLSWPAEFRAVLFGEIHKVAVERFGPGVIAGLQPIQQIVAALIMADLPDEALALAGWEAGLSASTFLRDVRWVNGALHLACEAELTVGEEPITFRRNGEVVVLDPPLSERGWAAVDAHGADILARPNHAKADVVVRQRGTSAEFYVPIVAEREFVGPEDGLVLKLRTSATIDPGTAASGAPLPSGVWDVYVRASGNGWSRDAKLGRLRSEVSPELLDAAVLGEPPRVVVPYWTDGPGDLAIDVGQQTNRLAVLLKALGPESAKVTDTLQVELPLHVPTATSVIVRYTNAPNGSPRERDGVVDIDGVLTAGLPTRGAVGSPAGIDVALTPEPNRPVRFVKLGLALLSRRNTAATVVKRAAASPAPRTSASTPAGRHYTPRRIFGAIRRRARRVRRRLVRGAGRWRAWRRKILSERSGE